jgi:hypothetical protein
MRATELLVREANQAVSRAGNDYAHQQAALTTLSNAYQLPRQLDHEMLADITQRLQLEKAMADIHKAQNTETEERLAVDERDQKWSQENDGRPVPASVHNQNVGLVQMERKGVGFGKQGETKEISQTAPDGTPRTGAAYRVGTNWFWAGTGEPVEGQFDFKSTARPRSAPAEYIDQLKKENPNISSAEISHANALFRADSAFASGAEGKSVNSLNTLADHLPLFEKYAHALETGDVRLVNRALQTLAEETGHPDITNYQLAAEFIADEAVKVMVPGGGGGALADREAMKRQLRAAMSQAQLGGAADVIKDFVHGKLGALRQQYSRGDPKLGDYFNSNLLTGDARRLFDSEKPSQGGSSGGSLDATEEQYNKLPSGSAYTVPGNPKVMYKP